MYRNQNINWKSVLEQLNSQKFENYLHSRLIRNIPQSKNLVLNRNRRDLFDFLGGVVSGVVETTGNIVGGVTDAVGNVVSGVVDTTGNIVSGVANTTGEIVSGVTNATGEVVNGVANATENVVSGTGDLIGGVVDSVTGVVSGVVDGVTGAVSGVVDGVTGTVSGVVGLVTGVLSLAEFIESLLESLGSILLAIEIVFNVSYALGNLFAGNLLAVLVYVLNIIAGLLTFT